MATATTATADADRRTTVLDAALLTFARYGYRKTSMEQVARDADISRPGLYFLFASKQALFQEAVERSVQQDLADAKLALAATDVSLHERLLRAFDHWAGRYVGTLTRDVATVVEDNPEVLGPIVTTAPQKFAQQVADALLTQQDSNSAARTAQTLISTSIGIKHQVDDRRAYLERLEVAIDLLLTPRGP
jgi:AcrR family transcriptional regulator